jgi:hypothetical protein
MRKLLIVLIASLAFEVGFAQPAAEQVQENYTLRERYGIMKSKSQTFKEYKVIKESVLDGVWKIIQDSIAAKEASLDKAQQNINTLNGELSQTKLVLKQKEDSMAETQHASTHINVIGIDFSKGTFLAITGIVFLGLILLTLSVLGRMKLLSKTVQERKLAVNMITHEYEEYKRKAMEKQTKLSRELQDERNKQSMRNG